MQFSCRKTGAIADVSFNVKLLVHAKNACSTIMTGWDLLTSVPDEVDNNRGEKDHHDVSNRY
jgi:hypothetical protein